MISLFLFLPGMSHLQFKQGPQDFSSLVAILQEHAPPEIDTFITSRLPYALSLSLLCHQAVCKYACAHNRGRANSAKIRVQI